MNKLYSVPPSATCPLLQCFWVGVIHVDMWGFILFHCCMVFLLTMYISWGPSDPRSLPSLGDLLVTCCILAVAMGTSPMWALTCWPPSGAAVWLRGSHVGVLM